MFGCNHLSFIPDIASARSCLVFWAGSLFATAGLEVARARQLVKHILGSKYNGAAHIAKLEMLKV